MTRGDSDNAAIAGLGARAWELPHRHAADAWFARVHSKLNPDDLPARDRGLAYKAAAAGPFSAIGSLFLLCRKVDLPYAS